MVRDIQPSRPVALLALACGALCALSGVALGQNALGDGSGLSRPMERDLGRNVPRRRASTAANFNQELIFRNAIVTGNAPGGTSFRGDIGYIAPNEFRAAIGSNDNFAFRRDSLYSGFAGLGIRGTEALQYQFALATGNSSGLLGVGTVSRAGGGVGPQPASTLADPTLLQEVSQARDPNRPVVGEAVDTGSLMGMLRSPSSYIANRGIQPEILGSFNDPTSNLNWGLTASALRGVRMSRLLASEGEGAPGAGFGPGSSVAAVDVPLVSTGANVGRPETVAPRTVLPTSYQAMLERFRETARSTAVPGTTPTTPRTPDSLGNAPPGATNLEPLMQPGSPEWDAQLQAIRDRLAADLNPAGAANRPGGPERIDPDEERLAENTSSGSLTFRPLDPETLRIIRRSSTTVQQYGDPTAVAGDPYADHMAIAGRLMQQEAYFDAEERFSRAQAARTDDYLASVGRVHAQIGAGLYLSAGMNLRRMLSQHPEVAATKFEASMLPSAARLERVVGELRANASQALEGQNPLLGADSALIIAYVGYQRQDEGLMLEGFDLYRRLIGDVEGAQDEAQHGAVLLDLIRQVWGGADAGEAPQDGK